MEQNKAEFEIDQIVTIANQKWRITVISGSRYIGVELVSDKRIKKCIDLLNTKVE